MSSSLSPLTATETQILLEQVYDFEFQFSDIKCWLKIEATVTEVLEALKTGLIANKPFSKAKLFSITENEVGSAIFIYDVAAAKSGQQPWSVECQPLSS